MSELVPLKFRPGINRESTRYANKGGWYDCNLIRFRGDYPEKIGGWRQFTSSQMVGTPRSLFGWSTIGGRQLYTSGTHLKYYLIRGGEPLDVTPIRRTVTLGTDPITTTTAGSTTVTVTDANHGAVINAFVTLSGVAGPIDGIPSSEFNTEHQITAILNASEYQIQVTTGATTGGISGGGSVAVATYQINPGLDFTSVGDGWGTGAWGEGAWGEGSGSFVESQQLRLWSQDNFGEDLLFNPRNGGIYYKDISLGDGAPGVNITDLDGSNQAPVIARQVLVSDIDRHVLAFACNGFDSTEQDPLLIRWADSESIIDWEVATDTTAGSLRLDSGSEIIRAIETQREILTFTDTALHSFRYVGPPFIFGQQTVGENVKLIGPNAVVSDGNLTFWMGQGRFQVYDGAVQEIPCTIKDYVYSILNMSQNEKISAGINSEFSEITWNMPVNGSLENNFYVTYNYLYQVWYYGFWPRTSWLETLFSSNPLATSPDGYIYSHEDGQDDGSTSPATPIEAYVESSDIEIGDGSVFMFVKAVLPDITFDGSDSTSGQPSVTLTLARRDYPGAAYDNDETPVVTRTATVPIEQFDQRKNIRLRGRSINYRIASSSLGVAWRQGTPRIEIRPDGKKS